MNSENDGSGEEAKYEMKLKSCQYDEGEINS
jgi:hypothetical protein